VRVTVGDGRSRSVHVRRRRCSSAARNPAYSRRDSSIKRVRELHWVLGKTWVQGIWKMAYRNARSTCGGGRPKSDEGDLRPPAKFCRVQRLGKLHRLMVKLTKWLAWLGSDRRELDTVAEARKAWRAVARRARGEFR
jgi:hypothetical protein